MEATYRSVREINSFAEMKESSYSNVAIDFVMNTSSYGKREPLNEEKSATDRTHDSFFLQCVPCAAPNSTNGQFYGGVGSNGDRSNNNAVTADQQMKANAKTLTFMQMQDVTQPGNEGTKGSAGKSSITHEGTAAAYMSTCYFRFKGVADIQALKSVLDALLYNNGSFGGHNISGNKSGDSDASKQVMSIFRMKGIVHAAGSDCLYILQSVHDIFDLQPSKYLRGSEADATGGDNLFVAVGKNIDSGLIEERVKACFQ